MKETKVYVDELPKICDECPCHSVMEDRCVLLRKQAIRPFLQSCPLKSLKTHDRELVKEVCGKIARNVRVRKIQEEWYAIETDLRAALDQIQKEYEK